MAASILSAPDFPLVHNRAGANMAGRRSVDAVGRGTARGEEIAGELDLFEVDEFWLDRVASRLRPRAMLLGNLFRDQLDRYGELETIADRWAALVRSLDTTQLALNADDPLIADLGRDRAAVTYYGVEDSAMAMAEMQHASDSKHCRRCGAAYVYDAVYLGHLGRCATAAPPRGQRRPEPIDRRRRADRARRHAGRALLAARHGWLRGDRLLPSPGLYNVYNALGAAACVRLQLGTTLEQVVAGLEAVSPAFGRAERIAVDGVELSILLMKNPAGANEILRTLTLESGELDLLAVLNDRTADGRDISWVWDADFELLSTRVRQVTCAGTRAAELALRLKYAGVAVERLRVVPPLAQALDQALGTAVDRRLFALPTYTALLELRDDLARRGYVAQFWEQDVRA